MSASVVASIFAQSILTRRASSAEMLTIAPRFARIGFSEGDDAESLSALCVRREEDTAFDFAERVGTDFAIISFPTKSVIARLVRAIQFFSRKTNWIARILRKSSGPDNDGCGYCVTDVCVNDVVSAEWQSLPFSL